MPGSQKLFRPYCSAVGISCVQFAEGGDEPSMPRYSVHTGGTGGEANGADDNLLISGAVIFMDNKVLQEII